MQNILFTYRLIKIKEKSPIFCNQVTFRSANFRLCRCKNFWVNHNQFHTCAFLSMHFRFLKKVKVLIVASKDVKDSAGNLYNYEHSWNYCANFKDLWSRFMQNDDSDGYKTCSIILQYYIKVILHIEFSSVTLELMFSDRWRHLCFMIQILVFIIAYFYHFVLNT